MTRGGFGPGDMLCRFPIRVETPYSAHYKMEYFSYLILRKNSSTDRSGLFQGLATDTLNIYGRAVLPTKAQITRYPRLVPPTGRVRDTTITKKYNRIVPLLYRRSRKLKWEACGRISPQTKGQCRGGTRRRRRGYIYHLAT